MIKSILLKKFFSSNDNDNIEKKIIKKIIIFAGVFLAIIVLICCNSAIKKNKAKQELAVIIEDSINQIKAEKEAEASDTENKFRDIYTINNINYNIDGFKKNILIDGKNAHIVINCDIEYNGLYKKNVAEKYFASDLLSMLPEEYYSDALNCKILINAYSMRDGSFSDNHGVLINVNGKKYIESSDSVESSNNSSGDLVSGVCSHCHGAGVTSYGKECSWCNGTGYWAYYD